MIEGVKIKKLKVIPDDRGFLMEMLRNDDGVFERFGQVYLSVCKPNTVKGWHYHKKQVDHFVVVKGNAKVVLYDLRDDSQTKGKVEEHFLGEKSPILLKIPTNVLHGITPMGNEPCYLINIPTEKYNYEKPDEFRISHTSKEIPYDWGLDKGG